MSEKIDEFPNMKYLCIVILICSTVTSQAVYLLLLLSQLIVCWSCKSIGELGIMWLYITGISIPLMFVSMLIILVIWKFLLKVVKT
jgi:hypothetical protein